MRPQDTGARVEALPDVLTRPTATSDTDNAPWPADTPCPQCGGMGDHVVDCGFDRLHCRPTTKVEPIGGWGPTAARGGA